MSTEEPDLAVLDPDLRHRANRLIVELAAVAGDEPGVTKILARQSREHGIPATQALAAAALYVTFTACIREPAPTDPAHPVPVTVPNHTQGAV